MNSIGFLLGLGEHVVQCVWSDVIVHSSMFPPLKDHVLSPGRLLKVAMNTYSKAYVLGNCREFTKVLQSSGWKLTDARIAN